MKNLRFVLVLALTLALFQSCTKEETTDPQGREAPELPAQEAFVMTFTDFTESDTTAVSRGQSSSASNTYWHWLYAAGNLVGWNTAIVLSTGLPTLAFFESFNHRPEYQGDGIWLWSYDVTGYDGSVYSAELFAELLPSDQVSWEMYLSKVGGFSRVKWYTGVTENDGSGAVWTLYHRPFAAALPVLEARFSRDLDSGVKTMRYTNISANDDDRGDYIEYRELPGAAFSRGYDVYRIVEDNLLEIQWNEGAKNGRIRDLAHYGDSDWRCWNGEYRDVDCQ